MLDLSAEGIARHCGPVRAGEYHGMLVTVGVSKYIGGSTTWNLHWKLKGVSAVLVDPLVIFSVDRPIASAWYRVAAILAANGKPLLFDHEGQVRAALGGCQAMLTIELKEHLAVTDVKPVPPG